MASNVVMNPLKEDLLHTMSEVAGGLPPDTRRILQLLAHPSVIAKTNAYFGKLDPTTMCTRYEQPWNCAREAEANYQNIKYGWTGGGSGIGLNEDWCDNCRAKVLSGNSRTDDDEVGMEEALHILKGIEYGTA